MAIIRRGFNRKVIIPPLELIEYRIALEFDYTANIIVPNVSWGIPEIGHECDILILRPSGYAAEIEIKRSMGDLKADAKKKHHHGSAMIRELWFCVSSDWDMDKVKEQVPAQAGIITYRYVDGQLGISRIKPPVINKNAKPFGEYERGRLLHLAHMRI